MLLDPTAPSSVTSVVARSLYSVPRCMKPSFGVAVSSGGQKPCGEHLETAPKANQGAKFVKAQRRVWGKLKLTTARW